MVVSQHIKVILDRIHCSSSDLKETICHICEVLSQNPSLDDNYCNIQIPRSSVASCLEKELILKALVDAKLSQLKQREVLLLKEKLKHEYFNHYTLYQDEMKDLKSCNLTDLQSLIDPFILTSLSKTLQTVTSLVIDNSESSKMNSQMKAELLKSYATRIEMLITNFQK
jgi:hypothetical protein